MHRKGATHHGAKVPTRKEQIAAANKAKALAQRKATEKLVEGLTKAYNLAVSKRKPRSEIDAIGRRLKRAHNALTTLQRITK